LVAFVCLAAFAASADAPATNHWAFQPIRLPPVPTTHQSAGWVQTPIDAFILAKLEERGLVPSPSADARTLVRRLHFDLLGLPPSVEEVEAFAAAFPLSHPPTFSPAGSESGKAGKRESERQAVAVLVDKLLASPHYGERWARHWLDVARYADTSGYLPKGQKLYGHASQYRDYVVRALNEDLPYDEFVLEQLAADQLPPRDGRPRPLPAMGFLTLGRVFVNNRHDIIDDRIDVVTRGLMGLTVSCARCHDHPFDPVPAAEYYALYGVFTNSWETVAAGESQSDAVREEFVKERDAARTELAKLEGDPTTAATPECAARMESLKARLAALAWMERSAPEYALALVDAAEPVAAWVFNRGNPDSPGEAAPRRFVGAASGGVLKAFTHGSGRLEMARAVVARDNPLTARVIVNRVWMHHFGEGLVRTPGDFGTRAEPPTHPELLDWLAAWFMDNGWSLKKLHRLIVTSAVYQQRSSGAVEKWSDGAAAATHHSIIPSLHHSTDLENTLLWRMNRRRLDFESTRDALLAVAGRLDRTLGGPPVKLLKQPFPTRRTLYAYLDRQDVPGLFNTFDFPAPDALCPRRFETTVPQSALFFLNGEFVLEQARHLATRLPVAGKDVEEASIHALFRTVLQRAASADELNSAKRLLAEASSRPFAEPAWQFGFGEYDATGRNLKSFARLPLFQDGSWRAGSDLPDKDKRFLSHHAGGGHPGRDRAQAAIRRWVSPVNGRVRVGGWLAHNAAEGDGVRAFIVSSRHGELGRWTVHSSEAETNLRGVEVRAGDTLDFIVDGGTDTRFDHFLWAPRIEAADAGGVWDARRDFSTASQAWDEQPLNGLELLAHALLMSNEFLFVD
jgi:hypothetical protein